MVDTVDTERGVHDQAHSFVGVERTRSNIRVFAAAVQAQRANLRATCFHDGNDSFPANLQTHIAIDAVPYAGHVRTYTVFRDHK
jgi:hypothetical protein